MTEHEMRVRLAEAMGWTDLDWYSRPGWITGLPPGGRPRDHVPSPLEFDTDAARLRAWCVGQGFSLQIIITTDLGPDAAGVRVRVYKPDPDLSYDYSIAESWVWQQDEPDPLRRERLALCRAVVQALDATDAGGEP